jgi:hypothetical protein
MNELDVVRGIGADTPDPDEATTDAARATLLAAIRAEAATGGPAVRDMTVDLDARRKARQARRRRLLPAGAAIAAVLATALVAQLVLRDLTPGKQEPDSDTGVAGDVLAAAQPAAVKVLTTAAAAAARAPEPAFGPGKYWYVRERGTKVGTNYDQIGSPRSFHFRTTYDNETWWALDGDSRTRETHGRPRFLSPAERDVWVANGRPELPGPSVHVNDESPGTSDRSDGWLPMTYEQIVELPTDPAQLSDVLSERLYAGQPKGSCPAPPGWDRRPLGPCPHRLVTDLDRYAAIVFLLTSYPLPAQLRSALYQALTRLDGIELTGEVTDLAGRRGVGVTTGPLEGEKLPRRLVLIFDPATGRLLGSRSVLAAEVPAARLTAGTVMEETAFVEMSVVGSPTARPKTGG